MLILLLIFSACLISLILIYFFPELNIKILSVMFFSQFFVVVIPFFDAKEINYSAYLSIILTFSLFVFILIYKIKKIDIVVIFLLWFLVNIVLTWDFDYVIMNYSFLTYPFTAITLYYLFANYNSPNAIKFFFTFLIISVVIEAAIGTSQSFLGFPIFEDIVDELYTGERNYLAYIFPSISSLVNQGSGTFEHFNGLGGLLSLTIPMLWSYWIANKKDKKRFLFFIIGILGVITTYSRGALIGSAIGILFIYVYKSNVSKRKFFKNILILSGILLIVGWSVIQNYYQSTENFSSRYDTWSFAVDIALGNVTQLIFGYGVYFFKESFLGLAGSLTNLHSGQLQILLELGVFGFALFIFLFFKTLKKAVKEDNLFKLSLAGGLVGFFFHQLFDNAIFSFLGILMFGIIGIINSNINFDSLSKWWFGNENDSVASND